MASATEIINVICPNLASDPNLSVYLEMATAELSPAFFGATYERAVALKASHTYSLNNSPARSMGEAGAISSKSEGDISISFANSATGNNSDNLTHYGQELQRLVANSGFGMRIV